MFDMSKDVKAGCPGASSHSAPPASIGIGGAVDPAERGVQQARSDRLDAARLDAARLDVARLGAIGSSLAHELNQPLAAIMNYVKAAQRTLEPLDDARAIKARELIVKAGEQTARAGNIIRDFRDFVGKRGTSRRDEKLHAIIEQAIGTGMAGAAEADIALKVTLDPELPVRVDAIQIRQVMINLLCNALEALQQARSREIGIDARRAEGGLAQVTVSDSGPGLSEAVAGNLFKPFITTKENGLGLGLTISRSIIGAHGGRLWATPNEGAGMSFHFQLPLAEKTEH